MGPGLPQPGTWEGRHWQRSITMALAAQVFMSKGLLYAGQHNWTEAACMFNTAVQYAGCVADQAPHTSYLLRRGAGLGLGLGRG